MAESKPLGSEDKSGANFVIEMLNGDPTYGINFDRIQWDNKNNQYIIIEFLLCEEEQNVNPWTSHPNKYFYKNKMKFISLWEITKKLKAKLYLINYAKKDTTHEDKVLVMEVNDINPQEDEPVKTNNTKMFRDDFSKEFRNLNKRGQK